MLADNAPWHKSNETFAGLFDIGVYLSKKFCTALNKQTARDDYKDAQRTVKEIIECYSLSRIIHEQIRNDRKGVLTDRK